MKIKVTVENGEIVARWLGELPKKITPALIQALNEYVMRLATHIRFQKLSGQVLHKRTGRLRESILPIFARQSGGLIWAGIGTNVKYAKIHEFGGVTRPHLILPRWKKALHFVKDGKDVFATKVKHPGSVIPARPYIRPSFEETQDQLVAGLEKAISESISKD